MSSIDEIRDTRIKKLQLLKQKGINPYPAFSNREISLKESIETFSDLEKSLRVMLIVTGVKSSQIVGTGSGSTPGSRRKDEMSNELGIEFLE